MSHLRWYASAALFVALVLIVGTGCVLCLIGQFGELTLDLAERIANRIEA
jgi:hypothetical protein